MSVPALGGIRVVELGDGVATAYLGALFAACGADVVKVEPPGRGDSTRHLPPFKNGVAAPEASGLHVFLNANKLGIAVDLAATDGAAIVAQMAGDADLLLEGLGPGRAETVGLGHAMFVKANPRLSMTSLSWFGDTGHRRDWAGSDAIAQALAGFIYPIGQPEGPPMIPGGFNAQITAAVTAFIPTMAALIGTLGGDNGIHIDQSVVEAQTTYHEGGAVRASYDDGESIRMGLNRFMPTYPQTIFPAKDGWIGVTVLTPLQWHNCCHMIGAPELLDDKRFGTTPDRMDHADIMDEILIPLFRKRTAAEWFHEGQAQRLPLALVPRMKDLAELDHFQARKVLAAFSHPDIGSFDAAAIPWKLAKTPVTAGGAAPRLGEHTQAVLGDLGIARPDLDRLAEAGIIGVGGRA
ncbi:MAG: CoA transferase [Pseudomonadota bacterium]